MGSIIQEVQSGRWYYKISCGEALDNEYNLEEWWYNKISCGKTLQLQGGWFQVGIKSDGRTTNYH